MVIRAEVHSPEGGPIVLLCDRCGWRSDPFFDDVAGEEPTLDDLLEVAAVHEATHLAEVIPLRLLGVFAATALLRDRGDEVLRLVSEAIDDYGRKITAVVAAFAVPPPDGAPESDAIEGRADP